MNESVLVGLKQPDQRSCGACSLVAARMAVDPSYAVQVARPPAAGGDFAKEALDLHRLVTGFRDGRGRLQMPWPRVIGTPPWAVAHQMSTLSGPDLPAVDYDANLVLGDRPEFVARMQEACTAGRPVPFYVGDRWLPRHVVLAVGSTDDGLRVYNPGGGTITDMLTSDFVAATLPYGRWTRPWFVVLPDLT